MKYHIKTKESKQWIPIESEFLTAAKQQATTRLASIHMPILLVGRSDAFGNVQIVAIKRWVGSKLKWITCRNNDPDS